MQQISRLGLLISAYSCRLCWAELATRRLSVRSRLAPPKLRRLLLLWRIGLQCAAGFSCKWNAPERSRGEGKCKTPRYL